MTRGINGHTTREAIRRAAIAEFRRSGYRGASLENIAATLGITRAAVLHHYGTKADLLAAVLDPYLDDVEAVIARHERGAPLTAHQRRLLIAGLTDTFLAHHDVSGILNRDISSHTDRAAVRRAADMTERLTILLTRPAPSATDRLVVAAILGAILRPLTDPRTDIADPATRDTINQIANTIARQRPTLGATPIRRPAGAKLAVMAPTPQTGEPVAAGHPCGEPEAFVAVG